MIHGPCSNQEIGGDVGHQQILGNIRKEQIEALMNCGGGVHTGTTVPNLQ